MGWLLLLGCEHVTLVSGGGFVNVYGMSPPGDGVCGETGVGRGGEEGRRTAVSVALPPLSVLLYLQLSIRRD